MTALAWAQFTALLAAALFFVVKLLQGWFMVNVSLSGKTERRIREDGYDDLFVTVTVTKGPTGSVRIHDTGVRVICDDGSKIGAPKPEELKGAGRLMTTKTRVRTSPDKDWFRRTAARLAPPQHRLDESWSIAKDLYRLPPGESTMWSCHLRVPTGQTCTVEVAVVGLLACREGGVHQRGPGL